MATSTPALHRQRGGMRAGSMPEHGLIRSTYSVLLHIIASVRRPWGLEPMRAEHAALIGRDRPNGAAETYYLERWLPAYGVEAWYVRSRLTITVETSWRPRDDDQLHPVADRETCHDLPYQG